MRISLNNKILLAFLNYGSFEKEKLNTLINCFKLVYSYELTEKTQKFYMEVPLFRDTRPILITKLK